MSHHREELLNVYDAAGVVTGARPRRAAKASGLHVGAVNALIVSRAGEVLLQRRPGGRDNGRRWDKSVGGHVSAGEDFDTTLRREAGEELFDDGASPHIRLALSEEEFESRLQEAREAVLLHRVGIQRSLRDVRHAPDGAPRNVLYHLAIYLGRTDLPQAAFRPQASEIAELGFFHASEVDRMLLTGALAPNMAFLWLAHAHGLLSLAGR